MPRLRHYSRVHRSTFPKSGSLWLRSSTAHPPFGPLPFGFWLHPPSGQSPVSHPLVPLQHRIAPCLSHRPPSTHELSVQRRQFQSTHTFCVQIPLRSQGLVETPVLPVGPAVSRV